MTNTKARLLLRRRVALRPNAFAELVLWQLRSPVPPSEHAYKYRLAYVVNEHCVVRYDNEKGKGDHKHVGTHESFHRFVDMETLLADFQVDIKRWDDEHPDN